METDVGTVAEEVASELRSLSSDELEGRAGRHRWGYVEPTEAAWELLEETVGAFDREVERLIKLGMIGPALDTALGVIGGLYRCRGCEDAEHCSPGRPTSRLSMRAGVADGLAKAGIKPPEELIADLAPDWAEALTARKPMRT